MSFSDGPIKSPQVDYKLRPIVAPRYKFVKMPMSNLPSASVGISSSSAIPLEWKLPANTVYNLARSYWQYTLNAPGQAAAAGINYTFEDVFELAQTVSFGAPGSQDLVSLQWASNYTKIARKLATPMQDYLSNDDMSCLYKCGMAASSNYVPGGGSAGSLAGAVNPPVFPNAAAVAFYQGSDNYIEPRYTAYGVIGTGDATGQAGRLDRYRQVPLSVFSGTLLGVDRDFFSPTEMSLRLLSNIGDKMAFTCVNADSKFPGAVSVANVPGNTCSSAGQGITINNCYLYLCVEQNEDIIQSMFAQYRSGLLSFSIPYLTSFRLTGGAAASQTNLQLSLSNMYGKKLKRILTTVWNPTERINSAYDCANTNALKIASYQTMLNSRPLQDRILNCSRPNLLAINEDDWLENCKFMDKNTCYTSKEMYGLNWFHIDQFYEPRDSNQIPEVNLSEGLDMIAPVTWQFSGLSGATAGLIYYIYAEFQRDIVIGPGGPIFAPIV